MANRFLRAALLLAAFSSLGLLHAQCVQSVPLTGTYILGGEATGPPNGPFTLTATNTTFSAVELVPNQTFTFAQLTSLFATFTSNSGGSGGGTPRFAVGVNDGGTERFITIDLGNSPNFTDSDAVLNTYSGFNVIGNNDAGRYQTGPGPGAFPGGSPFTTYSGSATSALTLAGALQVEEIDYITDTFSPFPSRNETLFAIGGAVSLACPGDSFQAHYVSNLHVGTSFVNIVNTGASATAASGFITGGNICVQVYAFDNSEELLACCTCEVTPNGLASIEVDDTPNGLFGNTETGGAPSSGVIKLVATADSAACGTAGGAETEGILVAGMSAWATTQHQLVIPAGLPSAGTTFQETETPFTNSSLSDGEYAHLTTFCSFDVVNGTKQGVCPGCSATALGAASSR